MGFMGRIHREAAEWRERSACRKTKRNEVPEYYYLRDAAKEGAGKRQGSQGTT